MGTLGGPLLRRWRLRLGHDPHVRLPSPTLASRHLTLPFPSYISANSYIVDSYSNFAASAIAAKTLMRSEIGAMVPLYVTQMFHNMGFQYAGLLLALISVAIMPIPFVFFIYGERIRQKSKLATKDA